MCRTTMVNYRECRTAIGNEREWSGNSWGVLGTVQQQYVVIGSDGE